MTDNPESTNPDQNSEQSRAQPEKTITVELPADIATAIEQLTTRSGQTDPQAILQVLRSALGLEHDVEHNAPDAAPASPGPDMQTIEARLTALESVVPRLEALEGKSIAF